MLELALKLADKESRLLLIALLEDLANADQHCPGNSSDDGRDGEREQQEQLLP